MGNTISDKVNSILESHLINFEQLYIEPTQHLYEVLDIDSLATLEIAMEIEDKFSIQIPDEQIASWKTIADIHKTVEELL